MTRRAWHWPVVLFMAWLPACGTGSTPGVAPAPLASQLLVFDAAWADGEGLLLPMTEAGIQLDTGSGGPACPPAVYLSPGGIVTFDPGSFGRSSFLASLGPAFWKAATTPAPADPAVLDGVENDCDLLTIYDEVVKYADALQAEAKRIVEDQQFCAETADLLYCDLIQRIEAAETLGIDVIENPTGIFGHGFGNERPDRVWLRSRSPCAQFYLTLLGQRRALSDLRFEGARCEDALAGLQHVIDVTGAAHSEGAKEARRAAGARYRRDAHKALESGLELLADIEEEQALLTRTEVEASCARCEPDDVIELDPASGGVVLRFHWDPLGAVVESVERAEQSSKGPNEAGRLEALALRLLEVPGDRVLHVTYRGAEAFGRLAVARANPLGQDDGVTPLVVVLSVLPVSASMPKPNAADLDLLHAAWRMFAQVLTAGP